MAQRAAPVIGAVTVLSLFGIYVVQSLETIGCVSPLKATANLPLSFATTSSVAFACAEYCYFNTINFGYFGITNRADDVSVTCYCFANNLTDILSTPITSPNLTCSSQCVDDRSPIYAGQEQLWYDNGSFPALPTVAVYTFEDARTSLICESICSANFSAACQRDPLGCITLIPSCYTGNATATAALCASAVQKKLFGLETNSSAVTQKPQDTWNFYFRSDSDATAEFVIYDPKVPLDIPYPSYDTWRFERAADGIVGVRPSGYIYPVGTQILWESDVGWTGRFVVEPVAYARGYPRLCTGYETVCDPVSVCHDEAYPPCEDKFGNEVSPQPYLTYPTLSVRGDGNLVEIYFDGRLTFAEYPYNPNDPPCFTWDLDVRHHSTFVKRTEFVVSERRALDPRLCRDEPETYWQPSFVPAWSDNGDDNFYGVLRQAAVYDRYQIDPHPSYYNLDRDVVMVYHPPASIANGQCGYAPTGATAIVISYNKDMNKVANCTTFVDDVQFRWVSRQKYFRYLTATRGFNGSVDVGAPDAGDAVEVGPAAFANLTRIAGSLRVWKNSSVDLSGCTFNISVGADFVLDNALGRYGPITAIGGTMSLTGDTRSVTLPSATSVASLILTATLCEASAVAVEVAGSVLFQGTNTINCTLDRLAEVGSSLEVDLLPPAILETLVPVTSIPNVTLAHASIIDGRFFPNLASVGTLWISDVATFDWPVDREPLEVQNLYIGTLGRREGSSCASLGGLRIRVSGNLVIDHSDLVDLSFLYDVTELQSLTITNNSYLATLAGLENLQNVTRDVVIVGNSLSLSISALGNLCDVGGTVDIDLGPNNAQYTSAIQPCPCTSTCLLCAKALDTYNDKLRSIETYVVVGNDEDRSELMAQALLCARAIPTEAVSDIADLIAIPITIANLSAARNETGWSKLAVEAAVLAKTQFIGPTDPMFVPMDATEVFLDRLQSFIQVYTYGEDDYGAVLASIAQKDAVKEFKRQQLDRSGAFASYLSNKLDLLIDERDAAITELVQAANGVAAAANGTQAIIDAILSAMATHHPTPFAAMSSLKESFGDLGKYGGIFANFQSATSNTAGWATDSGNSNADSELLSLLGGIADRIANASSGWDQAATVQQNIYLVEQYIWGLIKFIAALEVSITTAANHVDVGSVLGSGNFTELVNWSVVVTSLEEALEDGDICGIEGAAALCQELIVRVQTMALWGNQVTFVTSSVTEYERAIATIKTATMHLARYSQELAAIVDNWEALADGVAARAARHYADNFMATLSSVAMIELQHLCRSISYFAPNSARDNGACDVAHALRYINLTPLQLERRLSSVAYAYRSLHVERRLSFRDNYIPKVDITMMLDRNLSDLLAGDTAVLTVRPEMITTGPIGTDQNVQWRYIFFDLAGIPSTMGDPNAPHIDFDIQLHAPFVKMERYNRSESVEHTYTLWGVHANYAFRAKASLSDSCIASVDVPHHLADNICQDGVNDGRFSSAHYQLPTPFVTIVLRIANIDEILEYDANFFEDVTNLYLGGVVVTNPRYNTVYSE